MHIVGKTCPTFKSKMVWNNEVKEITHQDLRGHYTLLFFYAIDFSLICPTELHALQENIEEFKKRDVDVIAISVDSVYTHLAWLRTSKDKGGIEGTTFKLLSDTPQKLSQSFTVFDEGEGVPLRATFLIDPELMVQYGSVNNMSFGRSTGEILRVIDAIQFAAENGEMCPANWQPGEEGIKQPGVFKV